MLAGAPQWLLLRRHLPLSAWWITAVALGIGLTHGLVDGSASWAAFLPLIMLVSGIVLGVLQWLVTRRQFARAVWWIPVCALGWYLAWLLGALTLKASGLLGQEWTPVIGSQQHGLFSAIFGLVYGALSGVFWLYLLRRKGDSA
jgi:phosphoglycerol transferase MdoB-like AlkP superfamily enzyme